MSIKNQFNSTNPFTPDGENYKNNTNFGYSSNSLNSIVSNYNKSTQGQQDLVDLAKQNAPAGAPKMPQNTNAPWYNDVLNTLMLPVAATEALAGSVIKDVRGWVSNNSSLVNNPLTSVWGAMKSQYTNNAYGGLSFIKDATGINTDDWGTAGKVIGELVPDLLFQLPLDMVTAGALLPEQIATSTAKATAKIADLGEEIKEGVEGGTKALAKETADSSLGRADIFGNREFVTKAGKDFNMKVANPLFKADKIDTEFKPFKATRLTDEDKADKLKQVKKLTKQIAKNQKKAYTPESLARVEKGGAKLGVADLKTTNRLQKIYKGTKYSLGNLPLAPLKAAWRFGFNGKMIDATKAFVLRRAAMAGSMKEADGFTKVANNILKTHDFVMRKFKPNYGQSEQTIGALADGNRTVQQTSHFINQTNIELRRIQDEHLKDWFENPHNHAQDFDNMEKLGVLTPQERDSVALGKQPTKEMIERARMYWNEKASHLWEKPNSRIFTAKDFFDKLSNTSGFNLKLAETEDIDGNKIWRFATTMKYTPEAVQKTDKELVDSFQQILGRKLSQKEMSEFRVENQKGFVEYRLNKDLQSELDDAMEIHGNRNSLSKKEQEILDAHDSGAVSDADASKELKEAGLFKKEYIDKTIAGKTAKSVGAMEDPAERQAVVNAIKTKKNIIEGMKKEVEMPAITDFDFGEMKDWKRIENIYTAALSQHAYAAKEMGLDIKKYGIYHYMMHAMSKVGNAEGELDQMAHDLGTEVVNDLFRGTRKYSMMTLSEVARTTGVAEDAYNLLKEGGVDFDFFGSTMKSIQKDIESMYITNVMKSVIESGDLKVLNGEEFFQWKKFKFLPAGAKFINKGTIQSNVIPFLERAKGMLTTEHWNEAFKDTFDKIKSLGQTNMGGMIINDQIHSILKNAIKMEESMEWYQKAFYKVINTWKKYSVMNIGLVVRSMYGHFTNAMLSGVNFGKWLARYNKNIAESFKFSKLLKRAFLGENGQEVFEKIAEASKNGDYKGLQDINWSFLKGDNRRIWKEQWDHWENGRSHLPGEYTDRMSQDANAYTKSSFKNSSIKSTRQAIGNVNKLLGFSLNLTRIVDDSNRVAMFKHFFENPNKVYNILGHSAVNNYLKYKSQTAQELDDNLKGYEDELKASQDRIDSYNKQINDLNNGRYNDVVGSFEHSDQWEKDIDATIAKEQNQFQDKLENNPESISISREDRAKMDTEARAKISDKLAAEHTNYFRTTAKIKAIRDVKKANAAKLDFIANETKGGKIAINNSDEFIKSSKNWLDNSDINTFRQTTQEHYQDLISEQEKNKNFLNKNHSLLTNDEIQDFKDRDNAIEQAKNRLTANLLQKERENSLRNLRDVFKKERDIINTYRIKISDTNIAIAKNNLEQNSIKLLQNHLKEMDKLEKSNQVLRRAMEIEEDPKIKQEIFERLKTNEMFYEKHLDQYKSLRGNVIPIQFPMAQGKAFNAAAEQGILDTTRDGLLKQDKELKATRETLRPGKEKYEKQLKKNIAKAHEEFRTNIFSKMQEEHEAIKDKFYEDKTAHEQAKIDKQKEEENYKSKEIQVEQARSKQKDYESLNVLAGKYADKVGQLKQVLKDKKYIEKYGKPEELKKQIKEYKTQMRVYAKDKNIDHLNKEWHDDDKVSYSDYMSEKRIREDNINDLKAQIADIKGQMTGKAAKDKDLQAHIDELQNKIDAENNSTTKQREDLANKAAKMVGFDYTALTPAERNWSRKWVPFYNYSRQNATFQLMNGLHNSGALSKMAIQHRTWQQAVNGVVGDWNKADAFQQQGEYIPLFKFGNDNITWVKTNTPWTDVFNLFSPSSLSRMSVLPQMLYEATTGHSFSNPAEQVNGFNRYGGQLIPHPFQQMFNLLYKGAADQQSPFNPYKPGTKDIDTSKFLFNNSVIQTSNGEESLKYAQSQWMQKLEWYLKEHNYKSLYSLRNYLQRPNHLKNMNINYR